MKKNKIHPSSEPVEKIFSFGGVVRRPHRNDNFENQMIFKMNKKLKGTDTRTASRRLLHTK